MIIDELVDERVTAVTEIIRSSSEMSAGTVDLARYGVIHIRNKAARGLNTIFALLPRSLLGHAATLASRSASH
jgi:hypothetical protein